MANVELLLYCNFAFWPPSFVVLKSRKIFLVYKFGLQAWIPSWVHDPQSAHGVQVCHNARFVVGIWTIIFDILALLGTIRQRIHKLFLGENWIRYEA